jgi:hypothetical protein
MDGPSLGQWTTGCDGTLRGIGGARFLDSVIIRDLQDHWPDHRQLRPCLMLHLQIRSDRGIKANAVGQMRPTPHSAISLRDAQTNADLDIEFTSRCGSADATFVSLA